MAKTEAGKKIVYVKPYTYTNKSGKTVKVGQRYRSINVCYNIPNNQRTNRETYRTNCKKTNRRPPKIKYNR